MEDTFEEGQRVICINDNFPWLKQHGGVEDAADSNPSLGEVLVINEVLGEFLRFDKYDTTRSFNWWIAKHFAPFGDEQSVEVDHRFQQIADRVPFCVDWVTYKGETCFAGIDFEKSVRCGRPIIEVAHCATRYLNGVIIKTVNYDPKHFSPSHLGSWS
ncbi:hypothetical protein [Larkinella ripae]